MRDMDAVFKALSDPGRRRLLDRLNQRNGLSLSELSAGMGMTRQAVTKHLDVLEAAGLVTTLRRGREKLHYLDAAPITDIADRFVHHYDRARAEALSDLKTALEATTPMGHTRRAHLRVHDLHPRHARAGLAGPDRPGLHRRLLAPPEGGRGALRHRLAEGLHLRRHLRGVRPRHQPPRPGRPRVRPLPPAGLHLAHLQPGVGHPSRHRRGPGRRRGGPSPAPGSPSTSRRRAPAWSS